jgi:hypothetical protein
MAVNERHIEERNWFVPYSVTLYAVSTIVLALRIYSRLPDQLGLDDFFVLVAKIITAPSLVLTIQGNFPRLVLSRRVVFNFPFIYKF